MSKFCTKSHLGNEYVEDVVFEVTAAFLKFHLLPCNFIWQSCIVDCRQVYGCHRVDVELEQAIRIWLLIGILHSLQLCLLLLDAGRSILFRMKDYAKSNCNNNSCCSW